MIRPSGLWPRRHPGAGFRQRVFRRRGVRARDGAQDAHRSADRRRAPRARPCGARSTTRTTTSRPRSSASRWPAWVWLDRRARVRGADRAARFGVLPGRRSRPHRAHDRRRHRVHHHHGAPHRARRAGAEDRGAAVSRAIRCSSRKPTQLFMRVFSVHPRAERHGRAVVGLLGTEAAERPRLVHSEEELKMLVTASQEAGVLEEEEEQMLHRVFGFRRVHGRPDDGAAHRDDRAARHARSAKIAELVGAGGTRACPSIAASSTTSSASCWCPISSRARRRRHSASRSPRRRPRGVHRARDDEGRRAAAEMRPRHGDQRS